MNINDFEAPKNRPDCLLTGIFNRQKELMEKYHPIEKANGFLLTEDVPVNIHDAKGQARLKDFAWRFMEEIAEGLESWLIEGNHEHTREELADALHFFIELSILAGMHPGMFMFNGDLKDTWKWVQRSDFPAVEGRTNLELVVMYLGRAMNCLKNKPWKQTQMLTDVGYFQSQLINTFWSFLRLCYAYGIEDEVELYNLYFRKSQVNAFRIRSQY